MFVASAFYLSFGSGQHVLRPLESLKLFLRRIKKKELQEEVQT
jgi:hypothetical protein